MFAAKRIEQTYTQTINSTPEKIFPLLCPVREQEWLDDWNYTMLFSRTGVAEEGAVFSTSYPGEPDTIWIVARHDPEQHEVDFARFTPGSRATFMKIRVRPKDETRSYVDVSYSHTGITAEGNIHVDACTEEVFLKMVQFWERSMNYYLETGNKLVLQ